MYPSRVTTNQHAWIFIGRWLVCTSQTYLGPKSSLHKNKLFSFYITKISLEELISIDYNKRLYRQKL